MAIQVQLRRGTAAQNNAFTGAIGELSFDTTANQVRVHDGSTAGGFKIGVGDFPTGTNNVALGNTALDDLDGVSPGGNNTAIGHDALTANTTASFNTAIGVSSGSLITTGQKNTIVGSFDGNEGGLDIRTSSNHIVLSDGDGNPRLIIDNNGNVDIGDATTELKLKNTTHEDTDGGRESKITFQGEQSGGEQSVLAQIQASHDGTSDDEKGDLIFRTNDGSDGTSPTEAARIDSSQNLLVGKTATSSDTAGITLNSNGAGWFTGDGIRPLLINRKTSDGDIVEFRKDGSTMGSIGVKNGDILYVATADNAGQKYDGDNQRIDPCNSDGTTNDNSLDLGGSSSRFKDLYLSGGAYIGGTAAANYLDDYEEGVHNISFTMTSSGTVTTKTNFGTISYTKIGRVVHIIGNPRIGSVSSPVGDLNMSLPFTAKGGEVDESRSGNVINYYRSGISNPYHAVNTTVVNNTSVLSIHNTNRNLGNFSPAANDELILNFFYFTAT